MRYSEQSEQSTSSKSSENSDEKTNVVADGSGQGEEKNAETEASGEKDEE
uniref:Uncharacterized protein n=1 Tax=Heterorhabditis bacteriophora TaxID=37862 RepID=A0A1I7XEI1_HETBA